jgi:hypothetical protein
MARGTDFERLLRLARKHAILTIEEVKGAGIHTQALTRAVVDKKTVEGERPRKAVRLG